MMNMGDREVYSQFYTYLVGTGTEDRIPEPTVKRTTVPHLRETIAIPQFGVSHPEYERFAQHISTLASEGETLGVISNIVVHGSFGDYTAVPYSDVDLTLILRDGVIEDKQRLKQARRFITRRIIPFTLSIDPLQHHGPFVLWRQLQEDYNQAILPANVY